MIRLAPLTLLALSACFNPAIEQAYDQDGDGFINVELDGDDCDDENALINPDAPEVCGDGVDNNCDGNIDDAGFGNVTWYPDVDGDGYGAITAQQTCVAPEGSVATLAGGADCNDTDSAVHPGAEDECDDGVDNDCNGVVDDSPNSETYYLDNDLDGFAGAEEFRSCEAPQVSVPDLSAGVDCDDTNADISPREVEICGDGLDNNCDGATDDAGDNDVLWYPDNDGDGYPSTVAVRGCSAPAGSFSSLPALTDCNDSDASISPDATEIYYDGIDQNCDGSNDYDADGDGVISDAHGGLDCLDTNPAVNPSGQELCGDGLDNDCDGATDDSGRGAITWYIDSDNDGFPGATPFSGCSAPSGSFANLSVGTDCNDLDGSVRPNATEIYYDGIDQNCDGGNDYDADGDGVSSDAHGGQDCDDSNAAVKPGVAEVCNNGLDDDCSGDAPECAWPVDGDLEDVATATISIPANSWPRLAVADMVGDSGLDVAVLTLDSLGVRIFEHGVTGVRTITSSDATINAGRGEAVTGVDASNGGDVFVGVTESDDSKVIHRLTVSNGAVATLSAQTMFIDRGPDAGWGEFAVCDGTLGVGRVDVAVRVTERYGTVFPPVEPGIQLYDGSDSGYIAQNADENFPTNDPRQYLYQCRDFDGDGVDDLVTGTGSPGNTEFWYPGYFHGSGEYSLPVAFGPLEQEPLADVQYVGQGNGIYSGNIALQLEGYFGPDGDWAFLARDAGQLRMSTQLSGLLYMDSETVLDMSPHRWFSVPSTTSVVPYFSADVDADGIEEVVVSDQYTTNDIYVLRGPLIPTEVPTVSRQYSKSATLMVRWRGDWNGDGMSDVWIQEGDRLHLVLSSTQ